MTYQIPGVKQNRTRDVTGESSSVFNTTPPTPDVNVQTVQNTVGQAGAPGVNHPVNLPGQQGQGQGFGGYVPNEVGSALQGVNGMLGGLGGLPGYIQSQMPPGLTLPDAGPFPQFNDAPVRSLFDQFKAGTVQPQELGNQLRSLYGDYRNQIMDWVSNWRNAITNQFKSSGGGQTQ